MNSQFINENEVREMESKEIQDKINQSKQNIKEPQHTNLNSQFNQELSNLNPYSPNSLQLKESKLKELNAAKNSIPNNNLEKEYYTFKSDEKEDFSIRNQNAKTDADLKAFNQNKETDLLLRKNNFDSTNCKNNANFKNKNNDNYVLESNKSSSLDKSKYDTKVTSISIELEENPNLFTLFQGLIFMLLSCIFKSLFSILSKYAMNSITNLSSYQLLAFRTYLMLFISILVAFVSRIKIFSEEFIKADKVFSVFLRTILAITSMSLVVYCIKHLYVSDVYSVYYIYPAFLIVFSMIFFKEKITKLDLLCLLACIIGAILVVKPNFIFANLANKEILLEEPKSENSNLQMQSDILIPNSINNSLINFPTNNNIFSIHNINKTFTNMNINETSIENFKNSKKHNLEAKSNDEKEFHNKGFYILLVIIAALLKAIEDFIVKDIGKQVHFLAFPFMYTIIGIVIFPIPMLLFDKVFAEFTGFDVFLIFCISLCTFLYISFLALGFQNENAGRVAMINYFQIIFMYLSDLFLFDKRLEVLELFGILLIFGFNFTNGILKTLKRKKYLDSHINNNYKNDL